MRPFVSRLAAEEELSGWVRNEGGAVEVVVEGAAARLTRFARRLCTELPPLARLDTVTAVSEPPRGERGFVIRASADVPGARLVGADAATCHACLEELFDPSARRYRYPFTNCTDCGPRYTIIEALPYDRARTVMRAFPLCAACRTEYEDSASRRYHAEPIACPACGPRLSLHDPRAPATTPPHGDDALHAALRALRAGEIVAVKGLGGYQLACDAQSATAVMRLRARKARPAKPFALMARDMEAAHRLAHISAGEAALLAHRAAPIVLLQARADSVIAPAVAPGLRTIGVMLPATPLHHLLARGFEAPLVLTSGNRSDEPIVTTDGDALHRLHGIADVLLLHDRPIAQRYDDSVTRVVGGAAVVLRRARGFAPEPLRLRRPAPAPILALGGQLKAAFCLVRDADAFLSQHIGDLDDARTLAEYQHTLARHRALLRIDPIVLAHDLHADYATTRMADALPHEHAIAVQHHHAHVAACLAEHGESGPALGVVFDGAGYGEDGAVWGGELLAVEGAAYTRLAHLCYLPLPGGDAAARMPWRMALAALAATHGDAAESLAARLSIGTSPHATRVVLALARTGVNTPQTSSMGRLFDAVAALAGVCHVNRYEGEAAMLLESCRDEGEHGAYELPLDSARGQWDSTHLLRAVIADACNGVAASTIAARFHHGIVAAVANACIHFRAVTGIDRVVLTGGCMQNRALAEAMAERLRATGLRVLLHERVPPNDGGLALGQAAVAIGQLEGRTLACV